ncbi:MAG TPA: PilZ domain-containing protein [Phycisphaerae bacterium]|nr:PilZ domain-containing protein [Phycisphaerae bacterium]
MSDEPIPLWDGELSGAKIIFQERQLQGPSSSQTVRGKRSSPRRAGEGIHVCYSPQVQLGRVEHVECPVIDMSVGGLAIEFDQRLSVGVMGYVAYWTMSRQPVRVSCTVTRCEALGNGRFRLGLKLDRKLNFEERRPARMRPGRDLMPGVHPRKLREPSPGEPSP